MDELDWVLVRRDGEGDLLVLGVHRSRQCAIEAADACAVEAADVTGVSGWASEWTFLNAEQFSLSADPDGEDAVWRRTTRGGQVYEVHAANTCEPGRLYHG